MFTASRHRTCRWHPAGSGNSQGHTPASGGVRWAQYSSCRCTLSCTCCACFLPALYVLHSHCLSQLNQSLSCAGSCCRCITTAAGAAGGRGPAAGTATGSGKNTAGGGCGSAPAAEGASGVLTTPTNSPSSRSPSANATSSSSRSSSWCSSRGIA